eukprot:Hpha_TRINITY_DN16143_c5_g9::TRINITY_DN16143_c5_g9_i1::g.6958::m.6958
MPPGTMEAVSLTPPPNEIAIVLPPALVTGCSWMESEVVLDAAAPRIRFWASWSPRSTEAESEEEEEEDEDDGDLPLRGLVSESSSESEGAERRTGLLPISESVSLALLLSLPPALAPLRLPELVEEVKEVEDELLPGMFPGSLPP